MVLCHGNGCRDPTPPGINVIRLLHRPGEASVASLKPYMRCRCEDWRRSRFLGNDRVSATPCCAPLEALSSGDTCPDIHRPERSRGIAAEASSHYESGW